MGDVIVDSGRDEGRAELLIFVCVFVVGSIAVQTTLFR
jgi:hypothetical protein